MFFSRCFGGLNSTPAEANSSAITVEEFAKRKTLYVVGALFQVRERGLTN
jgi:hypothetical protein